MGRSSYNRVQVGDELVEDRLLVRTVDERGRRHDLRGVVTPVVRTFARIRRGDHRAIACVEVAAGELRVTAAADLFVRADSRVGLLEQLRREHRAQKGRAPQRGGAVRGAVDVFGRLRRGRGPKGP